MNTKLADIAATQISEHWSPLQWVGMQGIDLPIRLSDADGGREYHARAGVQLNLPIARIKGIHMSRLYQLLGVLSNDAGLSACGLQQFLTQVINSHQDCASHNARLQLHWQLLLQRPALVTPGLSGWKSYPVWLDAALTDGQLSLQLKVQVGYSSTCPCSAALSRQCIEQHFIDSFDQQSLLSPAEVATWLAQNATIATAHSQRSEAQICVQLSPDASHLGLLPLIQQIEQALATPLQTAVKRADEQAFALLNGQNLMFVEDAARRLQTALQTYHQAQIYVRHLESLHPHDAVAWASPA